MLRNQASTEAKPMRTAILDLPEIAVELSEREMRVVSGGLATNMIGCSPNFAPVGGGSQSRTNKITGGDWDYD